MEPITTIATGYATDKLAELGEHLVRTHVIERWTRKRAIEFYRAFSAKLLEDNPRGATLEEMLEELLGNEARSEIVFEAYRLVCLAKSKIIGPRVIAVLVAEIVQRDGVALEDEEAVLSAAEQLSDGELVSLSVELKKLSSQEDGGEIEATLETRRIDSNFNENQTEIGPGSLSAYFGPWAEKLKSLGMLTDYVSERTFHYREDSERHIDMDGSVRVITWKVYFRSSSVRLAQLVHRVSGEAGK